MRERVIRGFCLGYLLAGEPDALPVAALRGDPWLMVLMARASAVNAASEDARFMNLVHLAASVPPEHLLQAFFTATSNPDADTELEAVLYRVGQAHFASSSRCLKHIMKRGSQPEILGAGLWCATRATTLLHAVDLAQSAPFSKQQVAGIAGALMALHYGLPAIPTLAGVIEDILLALPQNEEPEP